MNGARIEVSATLLDELVCGNLHGEEYRRVLRALEASPQRWRDCALAFLREQAFDQELKALVQKGAGWGVPESEAESSQVELPASVAEFAGADSESARKRHAKLQWLHYSTSIAALLLISFTVGWMASNLRGELGQSAGQSVADKDPSSGPVVDPASAIPLAQDQSVPRNNERDSGFVVYGDSGQLASDRFMPIRPGKPTWLREFERQGRVRVDTVEGLVPMVLEDGTSALVPVQQYRLKPVIHSY